MKRWLGALLAAALAARGTEAQAPPLAGQVMEVDVRERWMHGRRDPMFTPLVDGRDWITVDSARAGRGGRALFLRLGNYPYEGAARVEEQAGEPARVAAITVTEPEPWAGQGPRDRADAARTRLHEEGRLAAWAWELVPSFSPARAERGARWRDTVALEAGRQGFRRAVHGTRVSTILGDTSVEGRRLWVVLDSARVRYEERWERRERTLDTAAATERVASGLVVGRQLYDPALRLFRARTDTARLTGEATLRYPDGRAFRTPVRYERFRRWMLHDPAAYARRRVELRAADDARGGGGMVAVHLSPFRERMMRGDTAARDSLLGEWQRRTRREERRLVLEQLEEWGGADAAFRRRLRAMRLEIGDTAGVAEALRNMHRYPLDEGELAFLLPYMDDPGLPFAWGMTRDPFYENLRQQLLEAPPAITPDTSAWACTPAACRMLAARAQSAAEPRLRDLGLVARMVLDPARGSDAVLARAAAGSAVAEEAALLARGVAATSPAFAPLPVPAAGAGGREWRAWLASKNPEYSGADLSPPAPYANERHAKILRFFHARTGRDLRAELRAGMAAAEGDSARMVFRTILTALGDSPPDPAELARLLSRGSPAERDYARIQVYGLERGATPADVSTTVALLGRLLDTLADGAEPFPLLDSRRVTGSAGRGRLGSQDDVVLVAADRLPPALLGRWKGARTVSAAEMAAAGDPVRPTIWIVPHPVVRNGPFVRVGVVYHGTIPRGVGMEPHLFMGTVMLWLLEIDGRWTVVGGGDSIT